MRYAVLVVCVVGCGRLASRTPSTVAEMWAACVAKETAETYLDEYQANGVAADAKYKGKLIGVLLRVDRIVPSNGITPARLVMDRGGGNGLFICEFDQRDEPEVVALKNGDVVAVVGTGTGQSVRIVGMDKCHVAKQVTERNEWKK